jgi:hypothetical protein
MLRRGYDTAEYNSKTTDNVLRMYAIDSIAIRSVDDNKDDYDVSILHNTE